MNEYLIAGAISAATIAALLLIAWLDHQDRKDHNR